MYYDYEDPEEKFEAYIDEVTLDVINELPCNFKQAVEVIQWTVDEDYSYCCALLFNIIEREGIINNYGRLRE